MAPTIRRRSAVTSHRHTSLFALCFAAMATVGLLACNSCKPKPPDVAVVSGTPTARLYLLSDVAGALEPCGCVKDQRGGMDRFAALLAKEGEMASRSALVTAGPLFSPAAKVASLRVSQEHAKGRAIAEALALPGRKDLPPFVAFAPAQNDLAFGTPDFSKLAEASGGAPLDGTLAGTQGFVVREIGGISFGFVGATALSAPGSLGAAPTDAATIRTRLAGAKAAGAKVFVLLGAVGRGPAKRIADEIPEFSAILIGSQETEGDTNTEGAPAELIGETLIVETANHLQNVGVLDFYLRDSSYKFQDASKASEAKEKFALNQKIQDLRGKIADLPDEGAQAARRTALREELASAEKGLKALENGPIPATGSYFRFSHWDIRPSAGADPGVAQTMLAFYKKTDEDNVRAFADRKPIPAEKGEPSYVGVAVCGTCHADAQKTWSQTAHAHAYKSLTDQFKAHNLDCVSCHVAGYDKPGGSTVTHVEKLTDVQCENCHGPGSKHVAAPKTEHVPMPNPGADVCTGCHQPPHVRSFDFVAKRPLILGPGHGR